jgi:hypothetical protein
MTNRTYKSGSCREQVSFFPPRLEDYVGRDNPVRAIEAYASSLDLAGLGSGTPTVAAGRASRLTLRPIFRSCISTAI